jgi:hypothetical protein
MPTLFLSRTVHIDGDEWTFVSDENAERVLVVKNDQYIKLGSPKQLMLGSRLPGFIRGEVIQFVVDVRDAATRT